MRAIMWEKSQFLTSRLVEIGYVLVLNKYMRKTKTPFGAFLLTIKLRKS